MPLPQCSLALFQPVPRLRQRLTRKRQLQRVLIRADFDASGAEYAAGFGYVAALLLVHVGGLGWADAFADAAFSACLFVLLKLCKRNLLERRKSAKQRGYGAYWANPAPSPTVSYRQHRYNYEYYNVDRREIEAAYPERPVNNLGNI